MDMEKIRIGKEGTEAVLSILLPKLVLDRINMKTY
jgi:hypothetical protein